MGAIDSTLTAVLAEAGEPLRPRDVRESLERRLGRSISYDTVASFLSVAARDPSSGVVRVQRGRYRA
jgi:hypothetical protein